MIASFMSSLITGNCAIIVITISIAIHVVVWFYRESRPNEVPDHQDSSDEGVYEPVDDNSATIISMTTNEAYVTTT